MRDQVYDFIVSDSQMDHASTILRNAGFRTLEPSRSLKCAGIFGTAGHLHVSAYDRQQWPIRLHLLPESLVHLSIHDTESVPSHFDQTRTLYRPKLPEHCVSLVRCLEDYPLRSRDRARPERYLTILFAVGVFNSSLASYGFLKRTWNRRQNSRLDALLQSGKFRVGSWLKKMSRIAPNSSIFYSQILRIIQEDLDAMKNLSICQAQNHEQVRRRNVQLR